MSTPSQWPLPAAGIRFLTPTFMVEKLARHPLTKDCYPTAMGHYPSATGHRMQRSRHDDNLLLYCVGGRGYLACDEWEGPVSAGHLMLLPQGIAHAYESSADDPWTLFWVHFQGASTAIFMQYLGYREGRVRVDMGVSPMLMGTFTSLMEVRRTGYSTRAFINAANQLRHMLTQMGLEIRAHQGRGQPGFELQQVQAYMMAHLRGSLTLDELAARANLSRYHFSKRYKALTGYSPVKHFQHMKMELACDLLDSTELGIAAVAREVGYEDPLYFSRLFKQTVGISPREYRGSPRK